MKNINYNMKDSLYKYNDNKTNEHYQITFEKNDIGEYVYKMNITKESNFLNEIYDITTTTTKPTSTNTLIMIKDLLDIKNGKIHMKIPNIVNNTNVMEVIDKHITVALHIINRIAKQNRFDILEHICKTIADVYFNISIRGFLPNISNNVSRMKIIRQYFIDNRADFIEKYPKKFGTTHTLSNLFERINTLGNADIIPLDIKNAFEEFYIDQCTFSYTSTPWEGIYINENIMGLLNYFVVEKIKKNVVIETIKKQSETLEFHTQKAFLQSLCWQYYGELDRTQMRGEINNLNEVLYPNDKFDRLQIKIKNGNEEFPNNYWGFQQFKISERLETEYKSDHIFKKNTGKNNTSTLIEEMLKPYFKNNQKQYQYCIFYLMSNQSSKSIPQINLLVKSQNIIENIVG